MRRKTQGTMEKDSQYVIGDVEMQILRDYISCFPLSQRTGRFFRKLSNKNGKICSTNQVIGKNMVSNYGKEIARILDLPDPDRFTGHCWRRAAVTLLANKGLSLPQIKCMSGHKSDKVVQGYIDKSEVMKELGAVALSVGGCSTLKPEVNNKRDVELNSTFEDEADYPLNKRQFI
eukprot:gene22284-30527_t